MAHPLTLLCKIITIHAPWNKLNAISASLLKFPEGEQVLFNSMVDALPLRRRASRLIPLPVPSKPKTRHLILTNRRLICLKQRTKNQGTITIKSELMLRPSEKLKEKDRERESRGILVSVEKKTEREFAVLTVSLPLLLLSTSTCSSMQTTKTFSYAAKDAELASKWIQNIEQVIESKSQGQGRNLP